MRRLWIDTETRSSIPIRRGVYNYVTAPDQEVRTVQWALDDEPVRVQMVRGSDLTPLCLWASTVDEIWAHGAEFDRTMLNAAPWWPRIPVEKWRCTMALARMHGLPGGLDKLSIIFKLGLEGKAEYGHELILLFCVPKKNGTYNDAKSHPAEWADFLLYAGQDADAMRSLWRVLPKWNATRRMWAAWHLDQKMNDRGVAVDLEFAHAAVKATTDEKAILAARTAEITDGEVESTTQRNRLLAFLAAQGVVLPDLTADTVERRLNDEALPEHVKELLRVRQQASKASTAKYSRVITHAINGRLHGLLLYCGAARTGRFSGRLFQPQNLPRPKHTQTEINAFIDWIKQGRVADIECIGGVMPLASSALRGVIVAKAGSQLVVSDYANIEGRICAWIAGELWKLAAFRAYDAKTGPDLYNVSYCEAFNLRPDQVDWKDERLQARQIGKVMELFLQYYGGVGAFCNGAETYRIDLEAMAAAVWPTLAPELRERALQAYATATGARQYGLPNAVWCACWALVQLWRGRHPNIVKLWYAVQNAVGVILAGDLRPVLIGRGMLQLDRQENWLRIRLPSGRFLSYPAPRMGHDGASFIGVNPYTHQWGRIATYSGKLVENIVQGIAADLLIDGLLGAEAANANPILSVHDEVICESDVPPEDLSHILISNSPWAAGLPLAAKGFATTRYHK